MPRNFTITSLLKKGSLVAKLLPFFISKGYYKCCLLLCQSVFVIAFLTSCAVDLSQYGRVVKNSPSSKNSFIFSVKEEYLNSHKDSKIDKKNPKMTEAESSLLTKLLKQQGYCLNTNGEVSFIITSKQEKIYDMTFAHLIEESYNARPLTPVMYYGTCSFGK